MDLILQKLSRIMRFGGSLSILAMALVTVADICGRLQKSPIFGSEEIVTFLAVAAVGLSLPYGHEHRTHIGVEVFVQLLSSKMRWRLKIFRETLSVAFFSVVTMMMTSYAHSKQVSGELSMNLGLPEFYLIYLVAICFAVVTLRMLLDLVRAMRQGRGA